MKVVTGKKHLHKTSSSFFYWIGDLSPQTGNTNGYNLSGKEVTNKQGGPQSSFEYNWRVDEVKKTPNLDLDEVNIVHETLYPNSPGFIRIRYLVSENAGIWEDIKTISNPFVVY